MSFYDSLLSFFLDLVAFMAALYRQISRVSTARSDLQHEAQLQTMESNFGGLLFPVATLY